MEYPRVPFGKQLPSGGTINPSTDHETEGWTTRLAGLSDEDYRAQMGEALAVRQAVHAGEPWSADSVIGRFMLKYSGQAEPNELFLFMMADEIGMDLEGRTVAQLAADYVRMDDPINLARFIRDYANKHGWEMRQSMRRTEAPNFDFIGRHIWAVEFMVDGLSASMDACFAEKSYWASHAAGYSRPEEFYRCGEVLTAYGDGCPAHGEKPAGHGTFAGHISKRASVLYNGPGVDVTIRTACMQLALARVLSFVHVASSCVEGFELGEEVALEERDQV